MKGVESDRRGVGSLRLFDQVGARSFSPDLQLFDSGCSEGISGSDQDLFPPRAILIGDLSEGGRLTDAIDPHDHDDKGLRLRKVNGKGFLAGLKGPEDFLFGAATNILSDFYNIPLSMGSFATGAKEPNWQAGIENSLSTLMASIVMSDMLLGAGLLHGSRIWSYEQLLMDCEIFEIVRKMMSGIEVNNETLAFDVIKAVGPGGNYLTQKHTRQHMRDLWVPQFMDRRPYDTWSERKDGARDWARAKAREFLATHQPEPLDEKLSSELARIISSIEN